eukprot:scaffold20.g7640.t1
MSDGNEERGSGTTENELQEAAARIAEATEALQRRRLLRAANLAPERPADEDELKKLDSSMKRNTALLRKLRTLSEESAPALHEELARTNQSKYVAEAVAAVAEAPLKLKDVPAAVAICSMLHQRYAEFGGAVVGALTKACGTGKATEEERGAVARRRALLRLLLELLLAGLYSSHAALLGIVRQLAAVDFAKDPEDGQVALSLLTAFAKAAREEVLGLLPALPVHLAAREVSRGEGAPAAVAAAADTYAEAVAAYESELRQRFSLPAEAQAQFRGAVERCFGAACEALRAAHAALRQTEADNARVLNSRGDLPEDMAAAYEAQRKGFEGLQRTAATLGEVLDRPLPELADTTTRIAGGIEVDAGAAAKPEAPQVFEDEEARAFYQSLPDLRAVVPAMLLADGKAKDEAGGEGPATGDSYGEGAGPGASAAAAGPQPVSEQSASSAGLPASAKAGGGGGSAAALDELLEGKAPEEAPREPSQLDLLLSRLGSAVSKELCDELAVNFCYMQNKGARRRLARSLCDVPWGGLQLLPYWARIAATLGQVFPDIPQAAVAHLEGEFAGLQRSKDATLRTLEARVRCMRYVGELAKFRLFPPGAAFSMLKSLLDDFAGHNIDAACALVETAGRFFHRLPETSSRMSNMLEVMMKLRNARNLDARQSGLVDSAYFAVKAADRAVRRKQRPPLHEYIRHLVYTRLALGEVTRVMKKLRRLPWAESERYLLATLLRASHKGRFSQIPHIASLAAGLARYHPTLGVALVDAVMEEVILGLESPDAGLYQRRVAAVRLLGELYNYRLVSSTVVFVTLHNLLAHGYEPGTPPEVTRRLDPPSNYFRIRLVCTLLGTCGRYFTRGAARRKLDRFAPYLQRYLLSKPPLPLDVEFDVQELWERLKVSPPQYESYEAACAAVAEIEARQAQAAAAGGLAAIEEESEPEGSEDGASDAGSDDEDGGAGTSEDGGEGSEEEGGGGEEEEEEEDEDEVRLLGPAAAAEVDPEFEAEFARLMSDYQGRPAGAAGPAAAAPGASAAGSSAAAAAAEAPTVAFRVMMRRGGREDKSRELRIPLSAGMAQSLREKEEREAAEKAEMKRLVLEADRRDQAAAAAALVGVHTWAGGRGRGARGYYGRGGGRGYG